MIRNKKLIIFFYSYEHHISYEFLKPGIHLKSKFQAELITLFHKS
jgi:hypothetical protein